MGDSAAPTTQESTASIIQALTANLPAYMQTVNGELPKQAEAQYETAADISPKYSQLLSDIYKQVAPELAQTGSQVENINRTGAAQTDLDILKGSGGELVRQGQALDKELNPEYYATRSAAADKLGQLMGSINLDNANPEAERLVNQENVRSGNINTPSATNTVANALNFGDQLSKRRTQLGDAISQATSFLQPSQSAFNPIVSALNRPSTNTGASQFNGVTNPGNQAYDAGSNLLNSATQSQQTAMNINANRRDVLDRLNETTSSIGSL